MFAYAVALPFLVLSQLTFEISAASTSAADTKKIVSDPKSVAVLEDIAQAITSLILSGADSVGAADIFNQEGLKRHILKGLKSVIGSVKNKLKSFWSYAKKLWKKITGGRGGGSSDTMTIINETKKEVNSKILQYVGDKLRAKKVPGFTDSYIEKVVKPTVEELILKNKDIVKAVDGFIKNA